MMQRVKLWGWLLGFLFIATARADLWVTGYYPGYESMPVSNIDFSAITHVIHFALVPQSNGSVSGTANEITTAAASNLVSAAHAAGRKALVCVGGAGEEANFLAATTSANIGTFVNNIVNFASNNNYDGVDLDWEPFASSDETQYTNLVYALHKALNRLPSPKLLTVASPSAPEYGDTPVIFSMLSAVQSQFDQINIMTYDMSGPYEGWVTWFNSPIYDGGYAFPGTSEVVPSINASISNFLQAGVQSSKLGVGTAFYGDIWTGGPGLTQPRQGWATNTPTVTQVSYAQIINTYYQPALYHWDAAAQAPYLGITKSPASNDIFLSYDDSRSSQSKVSFARNLRLGGVMIWELAQDYFPTMPAGQKTPLASAIKSALATPAFVSVQNSNGAVTFNFTAAPLGLYTVEWTSDLAAPSWTVLASNLSGIGTNVQTIQVTDPSPASQGDRFYRVRTP